MRILYVNNINQVGKSYGEDMTQRGHAVKVFQPSLAGGAVPLPIQSFRPDAIFLSASIDTDRFQSILSGQRGGLTPSIEVPNELKLDNIEI